MADESKQIGELPKRLLDLVERGAARSRKTSNRNAASFALQACLAAGSGLFIPSTIERGITFGIAGILLFLAMFIRAGNSLGPLGELPGVLLRGEIIWIARFPEKRGLTVLMFIAAPTRRWNVRATSSEVGEVLTLISRHAPSIHVEPHDRKRFRQWLRDPSTPPWIDEGHLAETGSR